MNQSNEQWYQSKDQTSKSIDQSKEFQGIFVCSYIVEERSEDASVPTAIWLLFGIAQIVTDGDDEAQVADALYGRQELR
jgi:hypothetical protein